jgi:mannosyltransferase OCH1-like enzyme
MRIPKIIYQTVADLNNLKPEFIQNRRAIAEMNPGWEMKLYGDDDVFNFIQSEFDSEILRYYLKINPKYGAARADFFRYLVVYKYGGLYLDIKSTTTKSLELAIGDSDEFITSTWPASIDGVDTSKWGSHSSLDHAEYQNWFILSSPGSRILEEVITSVCQNLDLYDPFRQGVGRMAVLETTGPIAYSKVLHKYISNGEARLASNEELGLKYSIYKVDSRNHRIGGSKNYRYLLSPLLRTSLFRSSRVHVFFFLKKVVDFTRRRFMLRVSSSDE